MGLDVYLYRSPVEHREEWKAIEAKVEEISPRPDGAPKDHNKWTDEHWNAYRAESRKQHEALGYREPESPDELNWDHQRRNWFNEDGTRKPTPNVSGSSLVHPLEPRKVEIDSETDPNHMFKIGYFRSSYNDGGLERVVGNLIGGYPLDYIFAPGDDYEFVPDWERARDRAMETIAKFEEANLEAPLQCSRFGHNMFMDRKMFRELPDSAEKALAIVREERKVHAERVAKMREEGETGPTGGNYSNRDADFFMGDPLKVVGIVAGRETLMGERPCMWVVYRADDEAMAWYERALRIVLETIEWVLAQPDTEAYVLHWSG